MNVVPTVIEIERLILSGATFSTDRVERITRALASELGSASVTRELPLDPSRRAALKIAVSSWEDDDGIARRLAQLILQPHDSGSENTDV